MLDESLNHSSLTVLQNGNFLQLEGLLFNLAENMDQ